MHWLEHVCKLLAEAIKGWGPTLRLAVLLIVVASLVMTLMRSANIELMFEKLVGKRESSAGLPFGEGWFDPARLSDTELINTVIGFDRVTSWAPPPFCPGTPGYGLQQPAATVCSG